METNLTLHLKMFNDKVKLMNQMNQKDLILSANEARNLHSDIFDLLNHCATLSQQSNSAGPDVITLGMDGGGF